MPETLQYDDEKREFSSPSGKSIRQGLFLRVYFKEWGAHVVIKWYICGNFVDGLGENGLSLYKSES